MCVHLAYCIIKAQKPAHRKGREVQEGGGKKKEQLQDSVVNGRERNEF